MLRAHTLIFLGLVAAAALAAGLAAQPTTQPATRPATRPAAIAFSTHNGYFVSNKFEPGKAESFVILKQRKAFDGVFGTTMVMGDESHRLAADAFDTKMVVAAIKRGKAMWSFAVKEVVEEEGELTVRYTATATKNETAEFSSPLIVAVPRGIYPIVHFEENGKVVKTIQMTEAELLKAAHHDANRADVELNKVYKQLMAVLNKDDRKRLVAAQRAWIAFRDAECEFESSGGADRVFLAPAAFQALTEDRTDELRSFLED